MALSAITTRDPWHRVLVWLSAYNTATEGIETTGIWTGVEDVNFTIGGETRAYYGGGQAIAMRPIVSRPDVVQMQELQVAGNSAEVEAILRGYDPRLQPIEVHVARYDVATGALVGIDRAFRGIISTAPRQIPAQNSAGTAWSIKMAPPGAELTRKLPATRSDAAQRQRLINGTTPDRIFRYADIQVEGFWGMTRTGPASGAAETATTNPGGDR